MGVFYFPPDFVYWTKVKNHDEIKKVWMNEVKNRKGTDHVSLINGRTSYHTESVNFLLENSNFLNSVVWEPLKEVIENVTPKIKFRASYVAKAWFSEYDVGGSVKYHNHVGHPIICQGETFYSSISLIYILHDENIKNQTVFTAPVSSAYKTDVINFETKNVEEISEGSVIIFPSSLMHKVDPIEKSGRVIVSMNIDSSFDD